MVRFALFTFAILFAVAGCVERPSGSGQNPTPTESGSSSASPSYSETATSTVGTPPINNTVGLVLDDCVGWLATINYPGPAGPENRPSNWSPAPPDAVLTAAEIQAYRCNRVSIGPLERGPIHLLFEGHTNADFPSECVANPPDGFTIFKVMSQIWVDDLALASYLDSEYEIPVIVGNFTSADQDLAAAATRTWSWATSQGESTITISDNKDAGATAAIFERYFWLARSGLVQLDLAPTDTGPSTQLLGHGTMQPPTAFAKESAGVFAGLVQWHPTRSAAGSFTRYSDDQCERANP